MKNEEVVARYECVDEDGNSGIIVEVREIRTHKMMAGKQTYRGQKMYRLEHGALVSFMDGTTFKELLPGRDRRDRMWTVQKVTRFDQGD